MKTGARRKTIASDRTPPPSHNDLDESTYNNQNTQQQQQQMLLLNDAVDRSEDEEDDESDEDYEDQSGDLENEPDVNERPKLAEGFYEIESVRKKRSRKVFYFFIYDFFVNYLQFCYLFIRMHFTYLCFFVVFEWIASDGLIVE